MLVDRWPLFGLRLRTPRLELRLPTLDQLAELADLAAGGVHDAAVMPFTTEWSDAPPDERARGTLQWHWRSWSQWSPGNWTADLVAVHDGAVVGTQGLGAHDFAVTREVGTGSWLGRQFQGQGLGTQMRAAVLHLAFAGLGAQYATSGAYTDNTASLRVSRRLGYVEDGVARHCRRGQPATVVRLRLDRDGWAAHRTVPVELTGLEPCLPLFGLDAGAG